MHAKLHIDISQGIIDVEGDPELVREVYADFKEKLLDGISSSPPPGVVETNSAKPVSKKKANRRKTARKKSTTKEGGSSANPYSPKMDKNLDTSDLASFYGQYEAKNHPEKVLIFLKFLGDHLEIEAPNADQVYTCYRAVDERLPKVFLQAFRDASGKKFGYIDYSSPTELSVTTVGHNRLKFNLKKKKSTE